MPDDARGVGGDFRQAAALNLTLHEATDLLFAEGNPVGAKAALAIKGTIGNFSGCRWYRPAKGS